MRRWTLIGLAACLSCGSPQTDSMNAPDTEQPPLAHGQPSLPALDAGDAITGAIEPSSSLRCGSAWHNLGCTPSTRGARATRWRAS
jgi:hypothetical protein